jgi:hypothetical protein
MFGVYTHAHVKKIVIISEYFETLGLILGRCDINFLWWIGSDLPDNNKKKLQISLK